MQWNEAKDILMMREVASEGVPQHKSGSKERGQGWQKVADVLNTLGGFTVNNRGLRDRLTNLMKKFKTLINKDKQLTRLGGDEREQQEFMQLQQRQHMEMQQQMVAMIAQQSALLKTIIEKK